MPDASDLGGGGLPHGQWDAQQVLTFTEQLRLLRKRVAEVRVSTEQRGRWQSRLAAISEGAATDLDRAIGQLGRLEADVARREDRR